MPEQYGYSLSFCITDILAGKVKEQDVIAIITWAKYASLDALLERYYPLYWKRWHRDLVSDLLYRLQVTNRIIAVRNMGAEDQQSVWWPNAADPAQRWSTQLHIEYIPPVAIEWLKQHGLMI